MLRVLKSGGMELWNVGSLCIRMLARNSPPAGYWPPACLGTLRNFLQPHPAGLRISVVEGN